MKLDHLACERGDTTLCKHCERPTYAAHRYCPALLTALVDERDRLRGALDAIASDVPSRGENPHVTASRLAAMAEAATVYAAPPHDVRPRLRAEAATVRQLLDLATTELSRVSLGHRLQQLEAELAKAEQ